MATDDADKTVRVMVLVDGECALCHRFVRWIVKNEKKPSGIFFASLQSCGIGDPESVWLIKDNRVYKKSDVLIQLRPYLKKSLSVQLMALKWIPACCRNPIYDLVARYRYRWFGKAEEHCIIEDKALTDRWLKNIPEEIRRIIQ
ncbi:MAG: DUF393 domain-containing protein [Bacteroidia bacterium]|nr:DUF393 domain-containing protein [Bacteroidia bacterium]